MATFSSIRPGTMPSSQRTTQINDVAAGDQIVISDILGRPARGVKFILTDASDTVDFRVNNYLRLQPTDSSGVPKWPVQEVAGEYIWSAGPSYSVQQATGAVELYSVDKLQISSIEIAAVSLSVGTTIELVVW